jgi:hypothetical protein
MFSVMVYCALPSLKFTPHQPGTSIRLHALLTSVPRRALNQSCLRKE